MRYSISFASVIVLLLAPGAAFSQIAISGTLLGSDSTPMEMARLVIENGPRDSSVVVPVDETGRFAFTLSEPGGYGMYATGVHHETQEMPLILTNHEKVELHIQLGAIEFVSTSDSFHVVVASSEEGVAMHRRPDGKFTARLEASADTLAYRIRYDARTSEWRSDKLTAGTAQDRFEFDDSGPFWGLEGDYYSVIDVNDEPSVDITFDPTALPQHAFEPSIASDPSVIARIATVYLDVEESERIIGQAGNFIQHILAARRERSAIRKRIASERDPLVRQWLLLRYFDELPPLLSRNGRRLAREALESVPTDSPLWSFEAWSPVGASNIMFQIARRVKDRDMIRTYVRRVIDDHPDPDVRAQFLYHGIYWAHSEEDEKTKWLYYSMLQHSHADTEQAERVRRKFDPDRALQAGNPVPQFSFVSFDDPTVTITNSGLRGRTYLLDFWGTWCAPCIKEIPALEKVYDRYKESGFEILSVAFLDDRTDIEQFRKERFPMPWLHTRVAREDDRTVKELFEITSIPRPILVSEHGIIIAIDDELRDGKVSDVVSAAYEGTE